ncbi:MAG: hypothetical protein AAGA18_14300 [Verrucomicrobiota bacterium]
MRVFPDRISSKVIFVCLTFLLALTVLGSAQPWKSKNKHSSVSKDRITALEEKVERLEGRIEKPLWVTGILFLYASVAAIWAQSTDRNAKKWFILGALLNVVTMIAIIMINIRDKANQKRNLMSLGHSKKKPDAA